MEKIKFEQMPEVLASINEKMTTLVELFKKILSEQATTEMPDRWFNVDELCKYLPTHPAKQTIYGKVTNKTIPFHKNGSRLMFLKSEIDKWLLSDKQKCLNELEDEAMAFIEAVSKNDRRA